MSLEMSGGQESALPQPAVKYAEALPASCQPLEA